MSESDSANRNALAARLTLTFAEELDDSNRTLVSDTLALEKNPSDPERERSVFRIMHTLKGAARAAGVPAIETLCHAMESELSRWKTRGAPPNAAQLALLLAIADAFADASQQLKRGEQVTEDSMAALMHRLSGRGGSVTERTSASAEAMAPPARAVTAAPLVPEPDSPLPEQVEIAPAPTTLDELELLIEGAAVPVEIQQPRANELDDQVRVGVASLDGLLAVTGELLRLAARMDGQPATLARIAMEVGDAALRVEMTGITRRFDSEVRVLQTLASRLIESVRRLRQRPFADIVEALPRAVRDVSVSIGKPAHLLIEGGTIEADRPVLEILREPLLHLVRNAVDHGLESPAEREKAGKPAEGTVTVRAALRADRLRVSVSDDGAGLNLETLRSKLIAAGRPVPESDHELAQTIFEEGFSTRTKVTQISGRGVGLEIVRTAVESVGGTVDVAWREGAGSIFTIEVPITVAVLRAVIADVGGHPIAIPTAYVERVSRLKRSHTRVVDGTTVIPDPDGVIKLISLAARLGAPFDDSQPMEDGVVIIRIAAGSRRIAAAVRDVIDEREVVMHTLDIMGGARRSFLAGASLLPDGNVALVLDVPAFLADGSTASRGTVNFAAQRVVAKRRILVADDSITTRTLEESVLTASGYEVRTVVDGQQAWDTLQSGDWDIVVSDIEMPRMTGIELCERIRGNPKTQSIPLILVTSLDKPEEKMRGLEAGADAYITKSSFDQDTLLDTIRQLIGRGEGNT